MLMLYAASLAKKKDSACRKKDVYIVGLGFADVMLIRRHASRIELRG
jgi:hypothetical protein